MGKSVIHFKKSLLKKIAQKYNLKLILIFGSQVEDKIHPNSDLDIAVLPKDNRIFGLGKYTSLIFDLKRVFPKKEIDLTFINKATPLLLKKISDTALLLFGDQRTFVEFRLKAFKYFQDYLPYFKIEERSVRQYLKQFSYVHR